MRVWGAETRGKEGRRNKKFTKGVQAGLRECLKTDRGWGEGGAGTFLKTMFIGMLHFTVFLLSHISVLE